MAGRHLFLQVPVAVFELHLLPGRDGGVQRIYRVKNFFIGGLDTPADQNLTVQLCLLVAGGELPELVDERFGLARRDKLAGVYSIHKQFQLRQLKGRVRHIIAAAAPALLHDVVLGAGNFFEGG